MPALTIPPFATAAWWRRRFAVRPAPPSALPAAFAEAIAREVDAIALAGQLEALAAGQHMARDLGLAEARERAAAREARRTPPL
jgi:hypothetical protein